MKHGFPTTPELAGERVDRAVSVQLGMSRARAQQLLHHGHVTVDGHPVAKSHRLVVGQVVTVTEPAEDEPAPPPPPVDVRYADDHLAVIAKPAGLVVHAGAGTRSATLVDALRARDITLADTGDPTRPGIVHRIDRGTSGLLVVAKTQAARAGLVTLFKGHEVDRRYWALVDGAPDPPSATIDAPIARDPHRRTRFRVGPSGRPAVSHYDVEESFPAVSRVALRLETGRTHQVRVHMAAIGHPVTGDAAYGADPAVAGALHLQRPALHAQRLAFTHPVTGAWVAVEEPLPEDLRRAEQSLRARAASPGDGGA